MIGCVFSNKLFRWAHAPPYALSQTMNWIGTPRDSPLKTIAASGPAHSTMDLTLEQGRDQKWEGFGSGFNELGSIAFSAPSEENRAKILCELFDPTGDFRFTIARLPIGASDYAAQWYSHNECSGDLAMEKFSIARDREYLLPYVPAATAIRPGIQLFASPWSPPT